MPSKWSSRISGGKFPGKGLLRRPTRFAWTAGTLLCCRIGRGAPAPEGNDCRDHEANREKVAKVEEEINGRRHGCGLEEGMRKQTPGRRAPRGTVTASYGWLNTSPPVLVDMASMTLSAL
jgi:hypothetical protein